MAVTCEISLQSYGFHRYNLSFQQQFFPPCFLLGMATAQPKCIKTGWPQKPRCLPCSHLHHQAMLLNRSYASRDQDLLRFHVKPTQPADPPRSALPAPPWSPARAEWPDGIFGLWPRLCFQYTEVRPKYYTSGRGYSEFICMRVMSTQKSISAVGDCLFECLPLRLYA